MSELEVWEGRGEVGRQAQFRTDLGDVGTRALWENDSSALDVMNGERLHRGPMVITDIGDDFRDFFENFRGPTAFGLPPNEGDEEEDEDCSEGVQYYERKLYQYVEEELSNIGEMGDSKKIGKSIKISLRHLEAYNPTLYFDVVQNPEQASGRMDEIIVIKYTELIGKMRSFPAFEGGNSILSSNSNEAPKCRLFDSPLSLTIRELGPMNIECLISIQAMIIRCSEISPEMQVARFKCSTANSHNIGGRTKRSTCPEFKDVSVLQGEAIDPKRCDRCKGKECFRLAHNSCQFSSKQLLRVTEMGQNVLQGETPQSIRVYVCDELIDTAKPGDRVTITGVYKVDAIKTMPQVRALNADMHPYITALCIELSNKNKVRMFAPQSSENMIPPHIPENNSYEAVNIGGIVFTPELRAEMLKIANDANVYENLTKSLAPSIIKKDDIKKGLLCQLFGGAEIYNTDKKKFGNFRKEIHILLCGDPSTGKSQLLQYVHKLASRGVCTSGKGSSSVGLTVSVGKDPDTKDYVLESGAVVLSDQGICCIDEFDKMDETARGILHEVMEQQTVSVAKVGIVASLNARTAILASANPINSRYDRRRAVIENINLPPSLFSRFDLIYLVLDQPDKDQDGLLAKGVCGNFMTEEDREALLGQEGQYVYDPKTMANYISYARAMCHPKITKEVKPFIVEQYMKLRNPNLQQNTQGISTPTATSRQLEGLIRLSQALARMELKEEVKEKHVAEAVRLINVATYRALLDPISGRLDFHQFTVGKSTQHLILMQKVQSFILQVLATSNASGVGKDELFTKTVDIAKAEKTQIDKNDFYEVITHLQQSDKSITFNHGLYTLTTT